MSAGDVFPRRNLPDDGKGASAEPWGREVETRIEGAEASIQSITQSLAGQNRSTASSLGDLASQVRDLIGRLSYNVSDASTQTWTSPTTTPYVWGPSVSFTLTESRVVSIQSVVNGLVYTAATSTTTAAFAYIRGGIFINGVLSGGNAQGEMGTNIGVAPNTNRTSTYTGSIMSRTLVSLNAGTYTVQGGFVSRDATVSGGTGSAYVTVSSPAVFVDVLQPAG